MMRFSLARAAPVICVFLCFVVLFYFRTGDIETSLRSKANYKRLKDRVAALEAELQKLGVKTEDSSSHRGPIAQPPLAAPADHTSYRASVSQEDCEFGRSHLKSNAELQTVDMYSNISFKNIDGGAWKQGFPITYDESSFEKLPLKVFVVPHSHNDPGWLKTFEKYFIDQTNKILDSVIPKLEENAERRFIWAEISFFDLWWAKQDESMRERVKKLINGGQLEMVTGGWVMNDEANTHYFAMIDQMIEGSQWLKKHLGVVSRSAWSIDPFGQSPTMAYILHEMGFREMLIQRTHYEVKKFLSQRKDLEFFWRQNWDLSSGSSEESRSYDMFTHMMPFYSYDVPHTCGPEPAVCCQFDFHRLPPSKVSCPWRKPPKAITEENVSERALLLLDQYKKKAQLFKTNVVLAPLGDDFRYDSELECERQFTNYEKIFQYINNHPELNAKVQWGTLSEYFTAATRRHELSKLTHLSGDFFTYADRDDHYWSGYFTSRPFYKRLDREVECRLRAAEMLHSLALFLSEGGGGVGEEALDKLSVARRNLGLFQHHDGITGTARDSVVVDYGNKLVAAIRNSDHVIEKSAATLLGSDSGVLNVDTTRESHDSLPQKTVLSLPKSGAKLQVVLYNSLGVQRTQLVSIRVNNPNAQVHCEKGNLLVSEMAPVWASQDPTTLVPDQFDLTFLADLAPLSLTRYQISAATDGLSDKVSTTFYHADVSGDFDGFIVDTSEPQPFTLENSFARYSFSENGLLTEVNDLLSGEQQGTRVRLDFATYGVTNKKDKSGAYLFLPDGQAKPVPSLAPIVRIERGKMASRVTVKLDNVIHSARVVNSPGIDGRGLAISNLVDIRLLSNREMAMRIIPHSVGQTFFTDLNGFQMQARHWLAKLPLQANFYPMPSQLIVEGGSKRLTLHSAQSLGAGMPSSAGHLDIILDRRLMQDDNRGLVQGVKDNKLTPNDFWLVLEDMQSGTQSGNTIYPTLTGLHMNHALNSPIITLLHTSPDSALTSTPSWSAISEDSLPCDVHVLNIRSLRAGLHPTALLLLHRQGFSCAASQPTNTKCSTSSGKVKLGSLLEPNVVYKRYTLNGVTPLDESYAQNIHINPMDIEAFIIERNRS